MLISKLAQKCFYIVACFAVVCFFVRHPVRDLLLPLSVPVVILSEGRIPKNFPGQNHPYLSTHTFHAIVFVCSLRPRGKTLVISTEGDALCRRNGAPHFTSLDKFVV
jgi:hypothetical protein